MSVIGYDPPTPPGIEPICGIDWLRKHANQYADWHPTIEITRPGSKHTITVKSKEAEREVSKMLRRKTK